jgi:hypothetical protein
MDVDERSALELPAWRSSAPQYAPVLCTGGKYLKVGTPMIAIILSVLSLAVGILGFVFQIYIWKKSKSRKPPSV